MAIPGEIRKKQKQGKGQEEDRNYLQVGRGQRRPQNSSAASAVQCFTFGDFIFRSPFSLPASDLHMNNPLPINISHSGASAPGPRGGSITGHNYIILRGRACVHPFLLRLYSLPED